MVRVHTRATRTNLCKRDASRHESFVKCKRVEAGNFQLFRPYTGSRVSSYTARRIKLFIPSFSQAKFPQASSPGSQPILDEGAHESGQGSKASSLDTPMSHLAISSPIPLTAPRRSRIEMAVSDDDLESIQFPSHQLALHRLQPFIALSRPAELIPHIC